MHKMTSGSSINDFHNGFLCSIRRYCRLWPKGTRGMPLES